MEKGRKKFYNDIILVLLLLITALSVLIILKMTSDEGAYAVAVVDGEEIARYSLDTSGEYSLNGGSNILVISDGAAYIKDANCPDKVCVHTGKVSLSGERIVCLPNKLEIRIVSDEEGLI